MMTLRDLPAVILFATSVTALAVSQISCAEIECGLGTTENNGVCVLADGARPGNTEYCAAGTHYDDNMGGCIADLPPTVCDGDTTVAVVNEDGVIVCLGSGTGGCSVACPQADPGKVTVCGTLKDVQTDLQLDADSTGEVCDPLNPSATGACSLEVKFYDALQFAQNPTGTAELPWDTLTVKDCGVFAATNIPAPALGFLAIGADDHENGAADAYVLAGVAIPVAGGERRDGLDVYVVKKSTDEAWTTSAGMPFGGQSFVDRGVYVPLFLHKGEPVAGVVVTEAGSPQSDQDYYFSDTDPASRATIDVALTETGANGSALLVDSELVMHSGTGAEADGCDWPDDLADAIPGVAFVQTRDSVDPADGEDCQ